MTVLPWIFLLVLIEPTQVIIQPLPVATEAECKTLVAYYKRNPQPNAIIHCVPHNAALAIDTQGPGS